MGKLWKILITPFLLPLAFAFGYEVLLALREVPFESVAWVVYGFAALLLFSLLVWNANNYRFAQTFEHELCHAFVSFFTFDNILKFRAATVAEDGKLGQVTMSPVHAGFFNDLAPYYLPVLTIPLLILRPFVGGVLQDILDFLIGVTLGFHYARALRNLGHKQSDLQDNSYIFSLVVIVLLNAIVLIGIVSVILQDMDFFVTYFQNSMESASDIYAAAWQFIQQYI